MSVSVYWQHCMCQSHKEGGQVGIVNVSDNIRNVFVIAKPITTFKHFNSEGEAIVNLRGR